MGEIYVLDGKKFIVPNFDLERIANKKLSRQVSGLQGRRREAFEQIARHLSAHVDWQRFRIELEDALQGKKKSRFNYYEFMEMAHKLGKKLANWVRKRENFDSLSMDEFAKKLHKLGKSICREIDETATCWEDYRRFTS